MKDKRHQDGWKERWDVPKLNPRGLPHHPNGRCKKHFYELLSSLRVVEFGGLVDLFWGERRVKKDGLHPETLVVFN